MCLPASYVAEARAAWKLLNGVVCVFKPLGMTSPRLQQEVKNKVVLGLNEMKVREPETIVELQRIEANDVQNLALDVKQRRNAESPMSELEKLFTPEVIGELEEGPDKIRIIKRFNLADHPLVTGPRYLEEDVKVWDISRLGPNSSGISVLGLNRGIPMVHKLERMRWLRTYIISGQFGIATNTGFHTGRIIDKSTYHKLHQSTIDRFLATTQASHQKNMLETSGISLRSERAYEIASQGLPRPEGRATPVIYSLKCIKFDLPNFEIEVGVVNETEEYLLTLIHDFGLRLHNTAVCTKIRCVKYGPFTLDLALLPKHYTPESFINNSIKVNEILNTVNLKRRDAMINKEEDQVNHQARYNPKVTKEVEYI